MHIRVVAKTKIGNDSARDVMTGAQGDPAVVWRVAMSMNTAHCQESASPTISQILMRLRVINPKSVANNTKRLGRLKMSAARTSETLALHFIVSGHQGQLERDSDRQHPGAVIVGWEGSGYGVREGKHLTRRIDRYAWTTCQVSSRMRGGGVTTTRNPPAWVLLDRND
ncbi:hypothetical protein BD779DRAFT_1470821 [Infundibulicybe gibba]|nr:hypothetical protein BD779DRAFT_1470821 [Infundibulicybe gibba]